MLNFSNIHVGRIWKGGEENVNRIVDTGIADRSVEVDCMAHKFHGSASVLWRLWSGSSYGRNDSEVPDESSIEVVRA